MNAKITKGIASRLLRDEWPAFIEECARILRPGGQIRLTEMTLTESNSADFNALYSLLYRAIYLDRRSFAPGEHTNPQSTAIIPALGKMLRKQFGNVAYHAFAMNHGETRVIEHWIMAFDTLEDYFLRFGLTSHQEYRELYNRAVSDTLRDDFWATTHIMTAYAYKSNREFPEKEKGVHSSPA